ncbi:MAG: U32 family peptidase [Candidatus Shapirobacteria bacterium]|nr:U32 family peptidase [Candidatus Shapirobacteria bacterium]
MNKVNILAPAGNFESLMAAINAGADEIYFGIGELNMRAAGANNFDISDLQKIANLCQEKNIKTWVTLNTVVYDEEIEVIKKTLEEIKKSGIDGIIAADLAVIKEANKLNIEVCASTQMSVSNLETVKVLSSWVDRIVLARELNLEQIGKIVEGIGQEKIVGPKGNLVEIEVFGHGAMCVAMSGRCQMSLYHYNLSANRGKCVQVCRRKYEVKDKDTGKELVLDNDWVMSRSDLCTIGLLEKLVEAGVKTIKIEGRARSADYVDTVVRVYKKALELVEKNNFGKKEKEKLVDELKIVFNRGFSTGFYMGRSTDEWASGENNLATETKKLLGQIEHFYQKIKVAEIKLNKNDRVKNGDEYIIIGPSTGVLRDKFFEIKIEKDVLTFKTKQKVRKNDKVFLVVKN